MEIVLGVGIVTVALGVSALFVVAGSCG